MVIPYPQHEPYGFLRVKPLRETHLGRYCREFDLRYNTRTISDGERANVILKGMEGKRLTYRRIGRLAA